MAWAAGVVLLVLTIAVALSSTAPGRRWLHRVDGVWFGERVRDAIARLRTSENWGSAAALAPGQDYTWLESDGRPLRIAHALGESSQPSANTLAAMRRAAAAGIRVFEVDLVSEAGVLRCQHDPDPQRGLVGNDCTFETLLAELPADAWLVLDIKSDFAAVGQQIVDSVTNTDDARRIVFQLYRPEDFALFNRWQRQARLPGPIVTTYLAHRSVDHVAAQVARIGVRALALPLERLPALQSLPAGAVLLVHPVHNCTAWADAVPRAAGVYTLSRLRCGSAASTERP